VPHIKVNEQRADDAHGKAQQIDERKQLVAAEIPKKISEEVSDHITAVGRSQRGKKTKTI
jgi:hypothetical protein